MYIWVVHVVVQQRLTQHCKVIRLHPPKKQNKKAGKEKKDGNC